MGKTAAQRAAEAVADQNEGDEDEIVRRPSKAEPYLPSDPKVVESIFAGRSNKVGFNSTFADRAKARAAAEKRQANKAQTDADEK